MSMVEMRKSGQEVLVHKLENGRGGGQEVLRVRSGNAGDEKQKQSVARASTMRASSRQGKSTATLPPLRTKASMMSKAASGEAIQPGKHIPASPHTPMLPGRPRPLVAAPSSSTLSSSAYETNGGEGECTRTNSARTIDELVANGAAQLAFPILGNATSPPNIHCHQAMPRMTPRPRRVVGVTWNLHRSIPSPNDFIELVSAAPGPSSARHGETLRDADVLFVGVQEAGVPDRKKQQRQAGRSAKLPTTTTKKRTRKSRRSRSTAKVLPLGTDNDAETTRDAKAMPWYAVLESVLSNDNNDNNSNSNSSSSSSGVGGGKKRDDEGHVLLDVVSLMGIQAAVYVKRSSLPQVAGVERYKLPTGILNIVGNKGAVGFAISFHEEWSTSSVDVTSTPTVSRYLLINSHFQAHKHKVKQRNNDYKRIRSKLVRGDSTLSRSPSAVSVSSSSSPSPKTTTSSRDMTTARTAQGAWDAPSSPVPIEEEEEMRTQQSYHHGSNGGGSPSSRAGHGASSSKRVGTKDITDNYEFVMWLGDFNYRINGRRDAVEAAIKLNYIDLLLKNDQLAIERCSTACTATRQDAMLIQGNDNDDTPSFPLPEDEDTHAKPHTNVFAGFQESRITFPPTYKFDVGSDDYDSSKKRRTPAWTDRVLYKINDGGGSTTACTVDMYDCVRELRCSDHKPVMKGFLVYHQPRPGTSLTCGNDDAAIMATSGHEAPDAELKRTKRARTMRMGVFARMMRSLKCNKVAPVL